jgi:hypothetical protein
LETDIKAFIIYLLKENAFLNKRELVSRISEVYPNLPESMISWHLFQLKRRGQVHSSGYGRYCLHQKGNFVPNISAKMRELFGRVQLDFPYVNFLLWDSRWFNEFMHHQIFRFYLVIEAEKQATEAIFHTLNGLGLPIYLNPDEEMFLRYISYHREVIIVKSLVSEAPYTEIEGIKTAPLEKLLVDCIADAELFAAQQAEFDFILRSVTEKYHLNLNKMQRYARRRNQQEKIDKAISIIRALI